MLVVKGLSRLPVTEEIAGSNPVEHAKIIKIATSVAIFSIVLRRRGVFRRVESPF